MTDGEPTGETIIKTHTPPPRWPPEEITKEVNLSKDVVMYICYQSNGNISYTYHPRNSGFHLQRFESYEELLSVHRALLEFIEKTNPQKQVVKSRFADVEVVNENGT